MPTYLCHGFRWYRKSIRVFVVLNDIEDAAADWVIGPKTSSAILETILSIYDYLPTPQPESKPPPPSSSSSGPEKPQHSTVHLDEILDLPSPRVDPSADKVLSQNSPVKLIEEFDPEDRRTPAVRPYAFIADYAVRIDLHANVMLEMEKYQEMVRQAERPWFEQLRSEMQAEEKIKWYVVSCGDDERLV